MKHRKHINQPYSVIIFFLMIILVSPAGAVRFPIDFHGSCVAGKYLNSDTTLYNMDASIELYCTLVQQGHFAFYIDYRDDLDMAEQTGGVSFDPRFAHYYIIGGFDYISSRIMLATYLVHDCIHDIDYNDERTPVFNRFRIQCADASYHVKNRYLADDFFQWNVEFGYYPNIKYHGWDVNSGADFIFDVIGTCVWDVYHTKPFGIALKPKFQITYGDTCWYHQHTASLTGYYCTNGNRIGLDLTYNIWNTDPLKAPDRLWILSLYVAF